MTGEQLGEKTGYSKQTVSHWEAGRFEPNMETLIKLCEVLDVSADWLLLGKQSEELSVAALKQAKYYEGLSVEGRRKWETIKLLVVGEGDDTRKPHPPKSDISSQLQSALGTRSLQEEKRHAAAKRKTANRKS